MSAVLDPDVTGPFAVVWRLTGAVTEHAPQRSSVDAGILADLPRDPADDGIVQLPGVRYRIGRPHPLNPFAVYLHRLDSP